MPTSPEIPLHLYQVLEEEYISLHGPIPEDEAFFVELHDDPEASERRRVKPARDWLFHEGHLKDPLNFARNLLLDDASQRQTASPAAAREVQPSGAQRRKLRTYLRSKLPPDLLKSMNESAHSDAPLRADLTRQLERALNENLLTDKSLYDSDRFLDVPLSDANKGLVKLRASAETFQGEDLTHFNRLLLEDAFPEAIERVHNIRLAAIHHHLHKQKQTALCLSGGGIRSGTFALGLIQGLARYNLLEKFDYLSTVSGGGYIGSWLTAWLHRHPRGLAGVTEDLANSSPRTKIDPDAAPIRYLRQYSNFITPKVGLLTADTWTFIGIYLRNLFLNWLVFIPLIIAVLLLPRLLLAITLAQPLKADFKPLPANFSEGLYNFLINYGKHIFLLAGFVFGVWSLAYIIFNRPGVREQLKKHSRCWRDRADQGSFLRWGMLPLLGAAICLTTYWAWLREGPEGKYLIDFLFSGFLYTSPGQVRNILSFIIFGLLYTFTGWVIASVILRRLPRSKSDFAGLILIVTAGLIGGIISWLISLHDIGNPIIGYENMEATKEPFPWTTPPRENWRGWLLDWKTELYVCLGVPIFLLIFLLGTSIYVGLSSYSKGINDEDREWWARSGAWIIISIMAWIVASVLVIYGPIALLSFPELLVPLGGVSGLIALIVGRSARSPATSKDEAKGGRASALMGHLLPVLAMIFLAILIAALSLATTGMIQGLARLANHVTMKAPPKIVEMVKRTSALELLTNVPDSSPTPTPPATSTAVGGSANASTAPQQQPLPGFDRYINYIYREVRANDFVTGAKIVHLNVLHHTSVWFILGLLILMSLLGYGLGRIINLNIFSLHGGYRNRLIRGFLGASRPEGERKPNPFTGFDLNDNIYMHELRPALLDEGDLIDSRSLAAALKAALEGNPPDLLSKYLAQNKLLENIKNDLETYQPDDAAPPPQLLAGLRATLNSLLEDESVRLYEVSDLEPYMRTARATWAQRAIAAAPRREYHILLNRLVMEQAYPQTIKQSQYPPPPYKLLHVINTALNLVGGDNLAWQQRKAEPFSITPLHAGCYRLGYRRSRDYGGKDTNGISIGTAAAISGAAASSNMGYYTTSPVISLLLTLFNVRLGWWLGNPGTAGTSTYTLGSPRLSFKPVVDEAFGLTNDRNKYVYLTDGGHFENLAIYEMVLRRCHIIVASDGAQDEEYRFGDLGNAVRKIRIDLGVPIEFSSVPIYAGPESKEKGKGCYWAIGKIRYSCIDGNVADGVLLYIKPAVYGNEPRDILEYKENFPAFPHQSTGDQFFDEPQFESYRMLGSHIMDQLCGEGTPPLNLYAVVNKAFKQSNAGGVFKEDQKFIDWLENWLPRKN